MGQLTLQPSTAMKNLSLLSATTLLLAAVSCSEGLPDEQTPVAPSAFTLHAVIGSERDDPQADEAQTRVTLTDPDDGSIEQVWKQYDQLTVINGSGSSETLYTFTIDEATVGTKTGSFTAPANYTGTPAFAVHPGVFNLNPAAWRPSTEAYYKQNGLGSTSHLSSACRLYAKYDPADGTKLYFRPLMSILRFDLTLPAGAEGAVTRLRLSAADGSTPFYVKPVFDLTGETATLTSATTASNDILLQVDNATLPTDKRVLLYLPAVATDRVAGKALTLEVTVGSRLYTARLTGGAIRTGKCHTITKKADVWTSTETYASGTGTAQDPYVLTSEEHLRTLAQRTSLLGESWSGSHFRLDRDITGIVTTEKPWLPIGLSSGTTFCAEFQGTFDGGGHTVSGTFRIETSLAGFFGWASSSISDLTIDGDIVSDYSGSTTINIGGIAGIVNCTLKNCHHRGSVVCTDKTVQINAGGIAGRQYLLLEGCTQTNGAIEISTTDNSLWVGGIIGCAQSGTVTGCRNESDIVARRSGPGQGYAGGIIGNMYSDALHTSYNSGNLTVEAFNCVGALVGSATGKVYKCSTFASEVVITNNNIVQNPTREIGDLDAATEDCPDGHSAPTE